MDEGDEYVPQISQMDYSLMEYGSGGMSNGSGSGINYYDNGAQPNPNSLTSLQQMTNMYGEASTSGGPQHPMQMMPPQGRPPHQMDPHMGMPNIPQPMAPPPQPAPPTKAKSRSRSKKNAANTNDSAPPTQQPLPPSYQMMGPSGGAPGLQNPAMMGQMRPMGQMSGQYDSAYWHQQSQMQHGNFPGGQMPGQGPYRQPIPQQYGSPYQQMPPQQAGAYPGYLPHMQMQQHPYYGQQPHPGAYPPPHQYPSGGIPPQSQQPQPQPRYAPGPGAPQTPTQQQQYYMDPNMQSYYQQQGYPGGYPQPGVKPGQMAPTAGMQPSAYSQQQTPKTETAQNQAQAAMSPHYRVQPNQPNQPQPQNDWAQRYPPSGGQPPNAAPTYYPQQMTPQQQQQYQELRTYQMEFEKLRDHGQRTPELMQRAESLQLKIRYLQAQLHNSQPQMMPPQQQQQSQQQPQQQQQQQQQAIKQQHPQMGQYPGQTMHQQGPPGAGQMMNSSGYPANSGAAPAQQVPPQMPPGNMQMPMPGTNRDGAPQAASSVAVMQTAPNQVQVNITPEAPCRTLISVYHQYPGPNVSTNVTTPSLSTSSEYLNTAIKDSIPPEPIPSSMIKKEQEAKQQQQQLSTRQPEYPPAHMPQQPPQMHPVQATQLHQTPQQQQPPQPHPYQNMTNTYPPPQANIDPMANLSTPISSTSQKVVTPPPPQPVPSMTNMSNDAYFSRTSSESSLTNHTIQSLKSPSRTMSRDSVPPPHVETKVVRDEDANQEVLNNKIISRQSSTVSTESQPTKIEPPPVIENYAATIENSFAEEYRIERIENSLVTEKVPEKVASPINIRLKSPTPKKEIVVQELQPELNHVSKPQEEEEEEIEKEPFSIEEKVEEEENEEEEEAPVLEKEEPEEEEEKKIEEEPVREPTPEPEPQKLEPESEVQQQEAMEQDAQESQETQSVSAESSTSTAPMKVAEETASEQPDISVDDSKLTTEVDDESNQVFDASIDEEMEETEEPETPKPKKKRGRQPKAGAAVARSEKRGRKPKSSVELEKIDDAEKQEKPKTSRKRKKEESENYEPDEDLEFVPQPSKRGKKRKTKEPIVQEEEEFPPSVEIEPNLEEFVEKRRSGRKKTEKKSYVDKEMDFELEEEPMVPLKKAQKLKDEQRVVEINVDDWIVDKILGVRTAKRMVKKKKPKEPSAEEEPQPSTSEVKKEEVNEKTNGDVTNKPFESPENSEASVVQKEEPMEKGEEEEKEKTIPKEAAQTTLNENSVSIEKKEIEKVEEENPDDYEEVEEEVEEIFVKFKNKSYLHCKWKTIEELEELDKRVLGKISRFKAKNNIEAMIDEDEYFNEDYTQVERVLDESVDEETGENYAFVKWRSMAYEDCTWETFKLVPESLIKEFRKRNNDVDAFKMKEKGRPSSRDWQKLPDDKEWKDGNTLRDYQFEGVNWLLFCWYNKQNCILADEMGLGKTVQTITFLQEIYDQGIHGPFLIVVPLSTLHNWEREFETWTDMNAVVYHGSAQSREIIQQYELFYPEDPDARKKKVFKFDVIITTYEMVVSDCETLSRFRYRVCVIDEAHRIKNRNCKLLTGGLLSFKMEHRVLLTGTPLQNNVQELFSLLNFLEPTQFSNSEAFLDQFGQCQTEEQVQKLQEILKPMMLRRLKEDVEKTLQPKEETIIEVQLSNIQKKYYRAILERNFKHLLKGANAPSLMNTMMELRKCCNHPFLINGAEEQILQELKQAHPEKSDEEIQLNGLIESSGKLVLINKLLPKLHQDGHKVLIFSQMVRVLDIIAEFLEHMNYLFERIDGNVRGDLRQQAIDRFCKPDSERFVFLLCTRAGGLGINLTAADTVIIFDSDWNPQNDLQAQARCHRIGQTKQVKVYRLITANTYEREMFDKASLKLGLDKAVLQSMAPSANNQQLTRKEVEDLLRKGAYGAVMDEDNEGSKFSEEDIDTILQRRTQTIRLEPGIKGSTFAKASFTSSNNREDIDVNDPNFWSKWAKKANIDVDAGDNELIMSEPRSRRKRFEENVLKDGGLSEEGDGSDEDTGSGTRTPRGNGTKNDNVSKNRSGKKRRLREEDDDYINSYTPDEFAFNKSEFFKVEKLLNTWGWGRWKLIKEKAELSISESDIEHISRILLLCCLREYKLDERVREFIWNLITPPGGAIGKGGKKGVIGGGLYHEGWAALPEYNPPAFAVDASFQRHVQRHATKLLTRVYHIQVLYKQVIGDKEADIMDHDKAHSEIQLTVPVIGDPPSEKWDIQCDKSFLIGIFKHGMENFEAIRTDPKLVFLEKGIEQFPTTIELNTRFKRLILVLQRQIEANVVKKWPAHEQSEFMRILRNYGVKDDPTSANVINWSRFRELSTSLTKKTDAEMLEQLYCVLAMCTKQQGGELSAVDQKRAASVESISARKAEKLMNRLHLMRKIHAIITTGIHNVKNSLKLCSTEAMPSGWSDVHDEQLLIVVDKWGLENISTRTKQLPAFQKIIHPDEKTMLRRAVEICTTIETGRWNGTASIDMIEDDELDLATTQMIATLQRTLAAASPRGMQNRRGRSGRKPDLMSGLTGKTSTPSTSSMQQAVLNDYTQLLSLAAATGGSNLTQAQQLQQLQQLQALFALTGLAASVGTTTASSSSSTSTSNNIAKTTSAAIGVAESDALNLSKKDTPKASSVVMSTKSSSSGGTGGGSGGGSNGGSGSTVAAAVNPLTSLSFTEILALSALPKETNIHVVHSETGQRLTGDKAPKLKYLEQWLMSHPKYKVDLNSMFGLPTTTSSSSTGTTPVSASSAKPTITHAKTTPVIKKESTPSTSVLATPIASTSEVSPVGGLEPGEIPKKPGEILVPQSPIAKPKATATPANDPTIGVFHRLTGISMPTDKCPTLNNLAAWLDKNPDYNVQTSQGALAKANLPKIYESRIGGESNTLAGLSTATSNNTTTGSSSTVASSSSAALNAAAMEMQMQILLQQTLMSQMIAAAGYNQYGALLGASGSSGTGSNNTNNISGMDAATLAALSALGAVPMAVGSSSSALNKTSSITTGTSASSAAAASSAQAMAEAALAAELMATMLNPTAMAMSSLQPYLSMDMATLTGLSSLGALTGASALTPAISAASNATTPTPVSMPSTTITPIPTSSTPQTGSNSAAPAVPAKKSSGTGGTKGKLDAVVEKLASNSNSS